MKFFIIEYFFLTFVFFTLFYIGSKQRKTHGIIPVRDLRHKCKTDAEVKLYDELTKQGLYVSPALQCGSCTIPIALEPFKIAVFPYQAKRIVSIKRLLLKHKELYVKSLGWKVIKISHEKLQGDLDEVIQEVNKQIKFKKV